MKGQKLSILTNINRNNDAFSKYLGRAGYHNYTDFLSQKSDNFFKICFKTFVHLQYIFNMLFICCLYLYLNEFYFKIFNPYIISFLVL